MPTDFFDHNHPYQQPDSHDYKQKVYTRYANIAVNSQGGGMVTIVDSSNYYVGDTHFI